MQLLLLSHIRFTVTPRFSVLCTSRVSKFAVTPRTKIHHSDPSVDRNIKTVLQMDRQTGMKKANSRLSQICESA